MSKVSASRSRWLVSLFVVLSLAMAAAPAHGINRARTTAWSVVPSPNEEGSDWLQAIDASAGNSAWSVGWYVGPEGQDETLAEQWDGSTWKLVDTPNAGSHGDQLYGVAAVSPSEAWAVGWAAGSLDTYTAQTVVQHWTGSAWTVV